MKNTKTIKRDRRRSHIRKHVNGTQAKPRLFVFKSNKFLHIGVADDSAGLVIAGTRGAKNTSGAQSAGKEISAKMKKAKVNELVFDRSGYKYHGVIAKLVDTIRENGIKI